MSGFLRPHPVVASEATKKSLTEAVTTLWSEIAFRSIGWTNSRVSLFDGLTVSSALDDLVVGIEFFRG